MKQKDIREMKKKMQGAIDTQFKGWGEEKIRCPSIKKMAEYINVVLPHLVASIIPWGESKDRKIGRLRSPGKRYEGSKLIVVSKATREVIFEHETTQTYRLNVDVAGFILKQEREE